MMEKQEQGTSEKASKQERDKQVRHTADVVAVIRFHEGQKENPLVDDPFAPLFVTSQGETMLKTALERWPFFSEYLIARAKFFDDILRVFLNKTYL